MNNPLSRKCGNRPESVSIQMVPRFRGCTALRVSKLGMGRIPSGYWHDFRKGGNAPKAIRNFRVTPLSGMRQRSDSKSLLPRYRGCALEQEQSPYCPVNGDEPEVDIRVVVPRHRGFTRVCVCKETGASRRRGYTVNLCVRKQVPRAGGDAPGEHEVQQLPRCRGLTPDRAGRFA